MNPQDALAKLHPLREPLPISWWPPAPGWWLLAAVVIIAMVALLYLLRRRYRANAYRRQALMQLEQLTARYESKGDTRQYLADINALLKSVSLRAFSQRDVAARSGLEWLAFLNAGAAPKDQFPAEFVDAAYQMECPDINSQQLQRCAASWIKRHRSGP